MDQLEERISEVEQFYDDMSKMQLNAPKFSSQLRNRRQSLVSKKQQWQVASEREAADKMQELMSQFANILHQVMLFPSAFHEWSSANSQASNLFNCIL